MELNRDNMKKIRGLIVFAVVVVVLGLHWEKVLILAGACVSMISPFLLGGAIAFVLNVPMRAIENHTPLKKMRKIRRPVCLVLSIALVAGVLAVVIFVVGPELVNTAVSLQKNIPIFFENVQTQAAELFARNPGILMYIEEMEVDWDKVGKDIIMSTGMCNLEEILNAVRILENCGAKEIVLLHCNTQYPTPYEDVNLSAMKSIAKASHKKTGYSDHTPGIEISVAAAAMGAVVIEKHFTLDKNMPGPDHKASLEPEELKALVCAVRNVEKALGKGNKELTPSEKENVAVARKSIVARKNIKAGEIFTLDNITTKRPGTGISPMKWYDVIGKTATRNFREDELIEL